MSNQSTSRLYWQRIAQANPSMMDESTKMTMSVAVFREQIEKAYNEGRRDEQSRSGGDLFGRLFS